MVVTRDNMIEMDGAENVWTDVMQIAITDDRYTTNVVMQIHFTPVPVCSKILLVFSNLDKNIE